VLLRMPRALHDDATLASVPRALQSLQGAARTLLSCLPAPAPASGPRATPVRAGPAPPPSCSLRGVSPALSIPMLLGLLSQQKVSGTLRVTAPHETFTLELSQGDVVHAVSDSPPSDQRLGRILVQQGAIRGDQLAQFLAKHGASPVRIGDSLQREELVRRDQLESALRLQVQCLFHRLFAVDKASFCFDEGRAAPPDVHIRESVLQLLLESARVRDEQERAPREAPMPCPS
jgi:hypothetical protein